MNTTTIYPRTVIYSEEKETGKARRKVFVCTMT